MTTQQRIHSLHPQYRRWWGKKIRESLKHQWACECSLCVSVRTFINRMQGIQS